MMRCLRYLLLLIVFVNFACETISKDPPQNTSEKLALPVVLNDCSAFELGDTLLISLRDTLCNPVENIWISFNTLLDDSRCPVNVVCFWEGNAAVLVLLSDNENVQKIKLNTSPDFGNVASAFGFGASLIDVLPYPHTDSSFVEDDYSVKLIITRMP